MRSIYTLHKWRFKLLQLVLITIFLIVGSRLFFITILTDSKEHRAKAEILPARQEIIDRNGEIIATNLITYSLYIRPSIINNKQGLVNNLTEIFPELTNSKAIKRLLK